MISPAEPLEVLTPQPVAVPHAAGLAIGRAVGLDGEHHPAGIVGVGSGEIHPVAADAVLRHDSDAALGEPVPHVGLERIQDAAPDASTAVPPELA